MSDREFCLGKRSRSRAVGTVHGVRGPALIASALLMLSAACGEEEPRAMTQGPVAWGEAGLPGGDAGFPPPVVVPPPPMDASVDPGPIVVPMTPDGGRGPDSGFLRPDTGNARGDGGASAPSEAGVPLDPIDANPCGADPEPLAANIRISEVSLYQTVKIPLYRNNAWVTMRNASVVQGKKTLIRAFVEPQTGYAPHPLRALLSLEADGKRSVLASDRTITRASTDDVADSTFDFQVDGALLTAGTQLSVSLIETTCMPPAANAGARLPATGTQALNPDAIGKLRVVVVPITLSGRTPDTSAAQLEKLRDALRAYYPVADVDVTARAPVTYSGTVQASGGGWSEVLSLVGRTRQQDAPPASAYYFGMMMPAATFRDYCRSGCVAGLAPQTTIVSRSNQIGLGVGFADGNSVNTMVHELGHAHGLPHAPCTRGGTIQGADARFPYAGAKIGVWGWDSRVNKLMSPATYVDVMSYCDPVWISDYYYERIATRCKAVNNLALIYTDEAAPTWHGIILREDGSAAWSGMNTQELPGEPVSARVLDAQGRVVRSIEVVRVTLSHSHDSFLYVPQPEAGWAAIDLRDLGGRVLPLADVAPATP